MNDFDFRLLEKLQAIKLVCLDVDGVMTDGSIVLSARDEAKAFCIKDGAGIVFLLKSGIKVVVITGRKSKCVERRCKELGIDTLVQGCKDKLQAIQKIAAENALDHSQVLAMGDDLGDLPSLEWAGVSAAPEDAAMEVTLRVDFTTRAAGGYGAVREVAELVLKAQNKWQDLIRTFSKIE